MSDTSEYVDIRLDLTPDTARAMLRLFAHHNGDLSDAIVQAILLADALTHDSAGSLTVGATPTVKYRH